MEQLISQEHLTSVLQVLELQIDLYKKDPQKNGRATVASALERQIGAVKRQLARLLQGAAAAQEIETANKALNWWEGLRNKLSSDPEELQRLVDQVDPFSFIAGIVKGEKTALELELAGEEEIGFAPSKPWLGCGSYEQFCERIDAGEVRPLVQVRRRAFLGPSLGTRAVLGSPLHAQSRKTKDL
jgi:hypothetical protein